MEKDLKFQLHWNYYLAIESELKTLTRFIEFSENNFKTNSIELSKLLMTLGSEIDVILKLICKDIFKEIKGNMKGYLEVLIKELPIILNESIYINQYNIELKPFKDCTSESTPFWWSSYNKVKHHRYDNYEKANLENVLYASGALLILNVYYYTLLNNDKEELDIKRYINNLSPQTELIKLDPEYYLQILAGFI